MLLEQFVVEFGIFLIVFVRTFDAVALVIGNVIYLYRRRGAVERGATGRGVLADNQLACVRSDEWRNLGEFVTGRAACVVRGGNRAVGLAPGEIFG